ncbi:hypothetical protein [Nitrobacter winogradskyi]|uniref:Uncharacterized protein n=2 Tax=Nitrobacter winogradskyi TaxID=913 RepID=A0ACC6ANX6_NITWI|nr:hypothetical protein [Nitrobacter winogradskyi]MCP2000600.1 hypothetical protein [Nitrobacter winogradskyi]GEC15136.1 hypothetical protein NWI01_10280 [Nitrobacter winogradskyi]
MVYLAGFHWVWLVISLLLGLAMGWIAVVHRGRGVSSLTARWLAAMLLALIVLAVMHVVPGRFGYWLDLGLVMLGVYLGGCAVGSWLRDGVVSRQAASGSTEHSNGTL